MSVNICLLVKDRPRLTEQCLRTLYANTPQDQFNLTIVDDGSQLETEDIYRKFNVNIIRLEPSIGIVGWLRNVGASASERYFGRGDYLYFSDNDIYFKHGWLNWMKGMMMFAESSGVKVLGGYRHPFHGVNRKVGWSSWGECETTDAVAGYSMLMRWDTFDKYGPFDQNAKGVCQSEDFAFCQKIIKDGGLVGYCNGPTIINCGVTNSEGKPAIGHEAFKAQEIPYYAKDIIFE